MFYVGQMIYSKKYQQLGIIRRITEGADHPYFIQLEDGMYVGQQGNNIEKAVIQNKKLLICGMGRSGKDTALEYLAKVTTLKNAGTTSKYLAAYVANKLNLPLEEAYARRHESDEMRIVWYNAGNELRENGPATLIKTALEHGDITGGVRDYQEIKAAKEENLVDAIIWIKNDRVPVDPTVKFSENDCDITITNNGTIKEFEDKLFKLAKLLNLPIVY